MISGGPECSIWLFLWVVVPANRLCHNRVSQGIMSGWMETEPTAQRSTRHSGGSRNPETFVHQAYVRADFSFHVHAD